MDGWAGLYAGALVVSGMEVDEEACEACEGAYELGSMEGWFP